MYLHHVVEQPIKTLYCSLFNSSKVNIRNHDIPSHACMIVFTMVINSDEIIILIPPMILHALKPVQQYSQLEGVTMEMGNLYSYMQLSA